MKSNIKRVFSAVIISAALASLSACAPDNGGTAEVTAATTTAVPEIAVTTTVPETTEITTTYETVSEDYKPFEPAHMEKISDIGEFQFGGAILSENSPLYKEFEEPITDFTPEQALELRGILCGLTLVEGFDGDSEKLYGEFSEIYHMWLTGNPNGTNVVGLDFFTYLGEPVLKIFYTDENGDGCLGYYRCDYDALVNKALEFMRDNSEAHLAKNPAESYEVQVNNSYTENPYGLGVLNLDFCKKTPRLNAFTMKSDVSLERETDGIWETVVPLGGALGIVNNSWYEFDRESMWFDLAWYPELSPGKYRIADYYYVDNTDGWRTFRGDSEACRKYIEENCTVEKMYYEFNLAEKGEFELLGESIGLAKEVYPMGTDELKIGFANKVKYFSYSSTVDVQYNENGVWKSVRKKPIEANLNVGYAMFGHVSVDLSDYDMSREGQYRVRMCVAIGDTSGGRFETWYEEFRIEA